jgi:serine/threonine-protein phosphatase PP1 catalytic subunit
MESLEQITKIMRPLEITNGVPLDMLWSDPEPYISGWQDNERGVSYGYGYDSVQSFLKNNKLDLIVRSHQIVENGFEFMFNKQLVTIFSVPNFMGEYDNYGAVMAVEEELKCSF